MSAARRMKLDWRGVPDLSGMFDYYSIASTAEKRPVLGNPAGKVLVAMSSTILWSPGGVSPRPFNAALDLAAVKCGAVTDRVVWQNEYGYSTRLFDLTKRGMIPAILALVDQFFPWADGIHWDYASAWSWQFPDMEPTDQAWDNAYGALFNALRAKGKLVLAQQWHLTNPVMAASGAFLEQSPTSFGYTMAKHAADVQAFREQTKRADAPGPQRPTLFVAELREPTKCPASYVAEVKQWASDNDIALSFGRDAQAGVGL